ncbi:hypothetical protein AHAS_Ahas11G0206800 [Arachis hypogaea]
MGRGTPNLSATRGVPLEQRGVARQLTIPRRTSTMAATWYRRRGTPAPRSHLGMPLKNPGVARQA